MLPSQGVIQYSSQELRSDVRSAVHARALGAGAVLCQPMLVDLVVILAPILVAMKFDWFGFSQ